MKIKEILEKSIIELKSNNVENPNLKARMLLSNVLDKPKEYLIIHDSQEITSEEEKKYYEGIQKIINKIPIQYIIKKQEFMKINFYVDENVLIPQPDTEILVEEVLKISENKEKLKILDLCTGCGCIAISLSKYIKKVKVTAIDISKKALQIAMLNAKENNVSEKIEFIQSDMFNKIKGKYDVIVSNPPYIKTEVINNLSEEVKKEPRIALDGGEDGLLFYRQIATKSYKYLEPEGKLCLEIGYDQKYEVIELLKNNNYKEIYCKKDLGGNNRIVVAKIY